MTQGAGDGRVFRVDFGHCHGFSAGGKGPGQQDAYVAPVRGGETAAVFTLVIAVCGRQFHAEAVDWFEGGVRFDSASSLTV